MTNPPDATEKRAEERPAPTDDFEFEAHVPGTGTGGGWGDTNDRTVGGRLPPARGE
jgi:hypothetical protein